MPCPAGFAFGFLLVLYGMAFEAVRHQVGVFPQPVGMAFYLDDNGMVQQTVQQGRGDDVIAEDGSPVLEAAIGGEDSGAFLVAGIDQLEEQVGRASAGNGHRTGNNCNTGSGNAGYILPTTAAWLHAVASTPSAPPAIAGIGAGIKQLGQPGVIQVSGERPDQLQALGPAQQPLDPADTQLGAAADVADGQTGCVPESEYVS